MVGGHGLDYPNPEIDVGKAATHMARTRIIECIGASDEDIAHLRLLLRTATTQLNDAWRWGPESKADLVIVDVRSLIGHSALPRTLQRGIACAQMIEADAPAPDGRYLRKPLRREDLVALLNGVVESTIVPLTIMTQGDDFFDMDLGESDASTELPSLHVAHARSDVEREHEAFEAMFRRDPLAEKPQILMPDKLGANVGVEYIGGVTRRSATRADDNDPFARDGLDAASVDPTFRHDSEARAISDEAHPLSAYLTGRLLGGPARIVLPGTPALVLDPKEQVFHALGKLPLLEPYCRQPLRLDAWERLVNSELVGLRERVPARPYLRLQWLERYIGSNGYLATHLDPGGSYRLTRWLELAQEYPRAFRIGSNMIKPQRLDEIAHVSEIPLAEVFDVVNAYEAIGYIEWTHRVRTQR